MKRLLAIFFIALSAMSTNYLNANVMNTGLTPAHQKIVTIASTTAIGNLEILKKNYMEDWMQDLRLIR